MAGSDTLKTRRTLDVGGASYAYYSLAAAEEQGLGDVSRLPFSMKVLLENMLRFEDGRTVGVDDVKAVAGWTQTRRAGKEIAYRPARVLMQDFTGVPAVVDLAAMRDAMTKVGGDAQKINPLSPVDLVIDHSVTIDFAGSADARAKNEALEFQRNQERYEFLKWGAKSFANFRVVPPGTGICHQVNIENLAQVVWSDDTDSIPVAYPDTLVGTDSHTTMVNGLGVLGWGVGGIEAEAAMLGQPISMLIPEVVGFNLTGEMAEGVTATDLVLRIVQMLREKGVVGKFVEFYGPALDHLSLPDRATIANMAPEYGATCGIFPIDAETLRYLKFTARDAERIALVEAYAKTQGMWRDATTPDPVFTDTLTLDISTVTPALAGPKRPQDRIALSAAGASFKGTLKDLSGEDAPRVATVTDKTFDLRDGDVVIAAITSCTNTSNPSVLIAAGLLAQKAVAKGLQAKPWVKTSLAPGSQVVADYLQSAGLQAPLDTLGFNIVGFGCTTCIGNSGPLDPAIVDAVNGKDLVATAVLSGNRNFEGRISPYVKANYLASPPLVVAYALAGSMTRDITTEPLGKDTDGNPVFLKDVWPTNGEIQAAIRQALTPEMFRERYANVFEGPQAWRDIQTAAGQTFDWKDGSTYVANPPYFQGMAADPAPIEDITGAKLLALLGDSVTTDHISPAGAIKKDSPAGAYLLEHQVRPEDFNSYGSRRGNHEVMMRGTFANIRIKNEMAPGTEGGVTLLDGVQTSIYEAAMAHQDAGTPLIVVAGKEYGTGSSRDWAAKGTRLLGVKAVLVESFERIHRSNLVGMGVLPLRFKDGQNRKSLGLRGDETFDITGIGGAITPGQDVAVRITRADGTVQEIAVTCRIDTLDEVEYYRHGGILQYVLRNLNKA
ncbi:aconitate hydratase AcnA [Varunaivibrio sulfuroxidans]|uniref:Aconitate hydratase n=1 Tax=Varunaivibrio sulfuroxidans TaxID=1773489 RepID=A0A4R3JCZ5_9PROT|nr:aconitate hydratase AcnA [Varunaivibrio sulfuroxidans]TCS63652.1 aconitase [Varunaivibrio sulfuroxidans]WES30210.1 aconitate hydratase AcnA [Varunaivibrio sulfuroxidans]